MSIEDSNPLPSIDPEFEQTLIEVEQSFINLKERYLQAQQKQQQETELQQRLEEVRQEWHVNPLPELERELETIQTQLQELEVTLESYLLSDKDLKQLFWQGLREGLLGEVFWQIVRFGGLGILIGWLLKAWAG